MFSHWHHILHRTPLLLVAALGWSIVQIMLCIFIRSVTWNKNNSNTCYDVSNTRILLMTPMTLNVALNYCPQNWPVKVIGVCEHTQISKKRRGLVPLTCLVSWFIAGLFGAIIASQQRGSGYKHLGSLSNKLEFDWWPTKKTWCYAVAL